MPDEMPRIGQPIVFLAFGGRDRLAAVVTRIHPDGTIALTTFPYGGGSIYHDRVPRHVPGEALHAWEPVGEGAEAGEGADVAALRGEIAELRAIVQTPAKQASKGAQARKRAATARKA